MTRSQGDAGAGGWSGTARTRGQEAVQRWLARAGLTEAAHDAGERVAQLTEEVQAARRANRELLQNLVSTEIERVAGRLGFARESDLADLRSQVDRLQTEMAAARPGADGDPGADPQAGPASAPDPVTEAMNDPTQSGSTP